MTAAGGQARRAHTPVPGAAIEPILPARAVAVDTREDWPRAKLYPGEQDALGRVVECRRAEFTTARACARKALARLGLPPASIGRGRQGEPCWPAGVAGSITHCEGYRACALARTSEIAALGIDAEPNEPLPDGVLGLIARAEEIAWVNDLRDTEPHVAWDRLLFSTKESVYKAWFPLAGCALGFEDVLVVAEPARDTFRACLLARALHLNGRRITALTGRWRVCDGLLLTAIAPSANAPTPYASRPSR
jgi:4'-phosphopantetheinyl transferase EntD